MIKESEKKLLLRTAILLQLQAAYPVSLSRGTIMCGLKIAGHNISDDVLNAELSYLNEKKLLIIEEHELSVSSKRIKLTHSGIEHLERRGF